MMILPLSKSANQNLSPCQVPIALCIPVEGDWLSTIDRELLVVCVSSALAGVIKNTIAAEYGQALSYWMRKSTNRRHSMARLMVQLDEAFELVLAVFVGIADQLSRYRFIESLVTELVAYDAADGSLVVRISDG